MAGNGSGTLGRNRVNDIKTRLERSAAVLAVIDYRRRQTNDCTVGSGLERFIVERELKELAEESMAAPVRTATARIDARERRMP
jgi:hypothetical protein